MFKHNIKIGVTDITDVVANYETETEPVYTSSVMTMDGIEHKQIIRTRTTLNVVLNPMTLSRAAEVCALLERQPLTVTFYDHATGADRVASMVAEIPTLQTIRGMIHAGARWVEVGEIVLEEL